MTTANTFREQGQDGTEGACLCSTEHLGVLESVRLWRRNEGRLTVQWIWLIRGGWVGGSSERWKWRRLPLRRADWIVMQGRWEGISCAMRTPGKERPHLEFVASLRLCSVSICSFLTISSLLAAPHSAFIASTGSFLCTQMCDGGGLSVLYFACLVGIKPLMVEKLNTNYFPNLTLKY